MGDRPSVFLLLELYVFMYYTINNKILIFVRFFPFFPASGRKYRILTMHKKQSVKNANICKHTILRYARNERVATMDELKGIRNLSLWTTVSYRKT